MIFNPIDQETKNEFFAGFSVVDCVVQNRDRFYLLGNKDYAKEIAAGEIDDQPEDSDKRIIRVQIEDGKFTLAKNGIYGFHWPVYCEIDYPNDKLAVMDVKSSSFFSGVGPVPAISPVHQGGPLGGAISRLRPIGKNGVVLVSSDRDVLIHKGSQQWERVGQNLSSDLPAYEGFEDFDGYSLDEIYAVGGSGVIFKYDGKRWQQMDFPTNIGLSSVCCGDDGNVYVGAGGGRIYRGKEHQWELMHDDELALPYRDMVWHKNQLWCSNDSGIWCFQDGKPVDALPPKVRVCCGHLSARDDVLLTAGPGGVALMDADDEWHVLFLSVELKSSQ